MSERITRVYGKDITYEYSVDWKQKESESKTVFTDRPCITTEITQNKEEICNFSGEPYFRSASTWNTWDYIYISEDEKIRVARTTFRADLNEIHLFTDKVMNENHLNKEDAETELKYALECFNKQMIECNEKLKDYCDIHGLNYLEVDCIKLFKLVYGHDNYEIVNGKMQERKYYTIKSDNPYLDAIKVDDRIDAIAYATNTISLNGVK